MITAGSNVQSLSKYITFCQRSTVLRCGILFSQVVSSIWSYGIARLSAPPSPIEELLGVVQLRREKKIKQIYF